MKALIITTRRTGSTFLVDCLDSHPQIKCAHEILFQGYREVNHPIPFLEYTFGGKLWRYYKSGAYNPRKMLNDFYSLDEVPVKAFKAMYHQLKDFRARQYLVNDSSIRIIHLRRDNLLKRYVSEVLTSKRKGKKAWHSYEKLPLVSTTISPEKAIEEMQKVQREYRAYDNIFTKHPKIELSYESIVNGEYLSQEATQVIADFLKIKPLPMKSRLVKTNPDNLSLVIENYDQVARALRNTEFEKFLEAV